MTQKDKILIVKTNSLITKAILSKLDKCNYQNIIENNDVDLNDNNSINELLNISQPDIIFLGFNNKELQQKFILLCNNFNIKKIYRFTNEKLDIVSKIAIISYYTDNVYGLDDYYTYTFNEGNCYQNYLKDKHIISDLIKKIHDAKIYKIPHIYLNYNNTQILYIHIDDLISHIFKTSINQKTSIDYKILEKTTIPLLIRHISEIIEYDGRIIFNDNNFEFTENSYIKPYTIEKLRYLYKDLILTNKNFNVLELAF